MNTVNSPPNADTLAMRINSIDVRLRSFVADSAAIAEGLGVHVDTQGQGDASRPITASTISSVLGECQANTDKLANFIHRTADFVWRNDEACVSSDLSKTPPAPCSLHARSSALADSLQALIPVFEGVANRLGIFFSEQDTTPLPQIPTTHSIDGDLTSIERSLCDLDRVMSRCVNKVGCSGGAKLQSASYATVSSVR